MNKTQEEGGKGKLIIYGKYSELFLCFLACFSAGQKDWINQQVGVGLGQKERTIVRLDLDG